MPLVRDTTTNRYFDTDTDLLPADSLDDGGTIRLAVVPAGQHTGTKIFVNNVTGATADLSAEPDSQSKRDSIAGMRMSDRWTEQPPA